MKRHGYLWPSMVAMENLEHAAAKARRGKRHRPDVLRFDHDLERNLLDLQRELDEGTYRPGAFRTFTVRDPKPRLISAAPYRDRVVHHALCNVLEPIFDRSMISDSYANRRGKGTHAAVRRCQAYLRRYRYAWKADISKYFPSIDHEILEATVARKVKDRRVLGLVGLIIDHSNPQEPAVRWFPGDDLLTPLERRRGLPLGNQTSQFLANVHLDPFDHFLKDHLRVGGYIRYVDDFVAFADDKEELAAIRRAAARFLEGRRLALHPRKDVIFPTRQGMPFLGYRVFATHRLLPKENIRRFRRRLRRLQSEYAEGTIGLDEVRSRVQSWIGHARQADTYRLRESLFRAHPLIRAAA